MNTPGIKIPLLARIVGWFVLNVAVLGVVAGFFAWRHLGSDWIFPNSSRVQVHEMADRLGADLRRTPVPEWSGVLGHFSQAYGFHFSLQEPRGGFIAGEQLILPAEVRDYIDRRMREMRPEGPPPGAGRPPPGGGPVRQLPPQPPELLRSAGAYWLVATMPPLPYAPEPRPAVLIGMTRDMASSSLLFDYKPWLLAAVGLLVLSAAAWVPLVRNMTKAIAEMTHAAQTIANGQFDIAVNDSRSDELGQLGEAINRMAGRLNALVTGQRRFLADIAHELCSPIARLEMALGVLEQRSGPELTSRVADAREEVREMSERVNELLDFSKAGLRPTRSRLETVILADIVDAVIRREGEGAGISNEIPRDMVVSAFPDLLTRAVANGVRNAVHHASAPIEISARRGGGKVELLVRDHGQGVPTEALAQLFEAFYRPDPARSRKLGGTGLGLAIVRSCVEACGGSVSARNHPEGGFELIITLPQVEGFTPA
jgi:two-component system sensor histidine kinase CpxA